MSTHRSLVASHSHAGDNAEHVYDKPRRSAIEKSHEQFSVVPSDRLEQLKKPSDLEPLVTHPSQDNSS
jgi:hypothetical protein